MFLQSLLGNMSKKKHSCPIPKINNIQLNNAKDLGVVMRMYNLIEYGYNYAKISRLWKYHRDDPGDNITACESFKFKARITGRTSAAFNAKDVVLTVPLKYLSNFWRTLEISLTYYEININLIRNWSVNCVMTDSTDVETFEITDTKL